MWLSRLLYSLTYPLLVRHGPYVPARYYFPALSLYTGIGSDIVEYNAPAVRRAGGGYRPTAYAVATGARWRLRLSEVGWTNCHKKIYRIL